MSKIAIVALTGPGARLAQRIADSLSGAQVHLCKSARKDIKSLPKVVLFDRASEHLGGLFRSGHVVIGICASGILIRSIAPHLDDKNHEPAVIAVSEDGASVVPLLGGHHGANRLAADIAVLLGAHAAVTTASDSRFSIALDDPPEGYWLANREHVKGFVSRLLNGEGVRLVGKAPWLANSDLPFAQDAELEIIVTEKQIEASRDRLVYHPAVLAVGVGSERGADHEAALDLVKMCLGREGLAPQSVGVVASLDLKEAEPAIRHVSKVLCCPLQLFDSRHLEAETPRLNTPSDEVFKAVGCHGVAEAAALASTGPFSRLIVTKHVGVRVTCAIAQASLPIVKAATGRGPAQLSVVGLGPGNPSWRSAEVRSILESASDLVGLSLYLDLIEPLSLGQRRHDFSLGEERLRVERALSLASEGRKVVLVSSGDAGIYGMASLVFEAMESGREAWRRVDVTVAPGISALQAAAARVGAPLGHDFCAISLSDLLTPKESIIMRLNAAARADFVTALYNPASKLRFSLFLEALDIFQAHRPAATPVIIARALGRPEENITITRLDQVDAEQIDMLTLVLVGASSTRCVDLVDGSRRVYTPRGYQPPEHQDKEVGR